VIVDFLNIDKQKIKYFSLLFLEKVIFIGFHLYFVNKISRDYYGIFTQTNYISSFISNILLFGFAIPFLINSTRTNNAYDNDIFQFFKNLSILISFFLIPIFLIFGLYFSNYIYGDEIYFSYLVILLLTIIADTTSEYFNLHNRIQSNLSVYSNFILSRTIVRVVSLLLIFIIIEDFFIAYFVSSLIFLTYVIFSSRKINFFSLNPLKLFKDHKQNISKLFQDGFKFLSLFILNTASGLLVNLILVNRFDVETLAIYSFNLTIASIPISISQYITFYSLPDFSKKFFSNKSEGRVSLIKDVVFSILIFFLIFFVIYFTYDIIFFNFINPEYSNKNLFILVFFSNTLLMINNFIQFPLLSENKYNSVLGIVSFSLIVNVIFLFLNSESITIFTPVIGLLIANSLMLVLLFFFNFNLKNVK
jgi:O-antigen/teichoic acid export membrane protein